MRIIAAITLAVLLGLAGVITLLARGTELPWASDVLARQAGSLLGRPVHLAEAPFVKIGRDLRIRLRGVSVDNTSWAGAEPLAELVEADVVLETRSLFGDAPLHLRKVRIDRLHLRLARDETGRSNLPEVLTEDDAEESINDPEQERQGLPFVLDELSISDVVIERDNSEVGTQLAFTIASMTQMEDDSNELRIDAHGTLQDQPWSLRGSHSGLNSLATGRDLRGEATAKLADLSLDVDYRLARLRHPEDLTLRAFLAGTPPPRIVELSPLLNIDQPLSLETTVTDIDPGIAIDALLDLGDTVLRVNGIADDPRSGDGLDLSIDADVSSLSRLAQALNIGRADDVTLTIDGHLRRRGRSVHIEDLLLVADGHRIEGEVLLPLLPGTTDARVRLTASGPDFGFYQRLLDRPFAFDTPYSAELELSDFGDGRESVQADVHLGAAEVHASGRLGDFPSYRNSELQLVARAEDLAVVGQLIDLSLPSVGFALQGDVSVDDAGRIVIANTRIEAADVSATLDGSLDTYPELDDLDLRLTASTQSLESTSLAFNGPALGAVPASLAAAVHGSATNLTVDSISGSAGGSRFETLDGNLRLVEGEPASNLHLALHVGALSELLGDLGGSAEKPGAGDATPLPPSDGTIGAASRSVAEQRSTPGLRDRPFSFELMTNISSDRLSVGVAELKGAGISGSAEWRSTLDFTPDETMHLSADLRLEEISSLLPPVAGYTPPTGTMALRADTSAVPRRISAQLLAEDNELLGLDFTPRQGPSPAQVRIRGAGEDLRLLGSIEGLPESDLPFRIQAVGTESETDWRLTVEELRVGDSIISDTSVVADKASGAIKAAINVTQADLEAWLPARTDTAPAPGSATPPDTPPDVATQPGQRARLIPATPLPLEILDGRPLDISVRSGSLGWPDPQFPERSLIERAELSLVRLDGRAQLRVTELRGSRGNLVLKVIGERAENGATVTTDFDLDGLPIGILTSDLDPKKLPKHRVSGIFTGRGETVRDLAATLNGELLLQGTGGELKNLNLRLLTESFLAQLFSTLLPVLKTDTPSLQVDCSVLALRARDGVVALDPGFVIRTDRVDLSARGSINLATERMKIRFDNQARRGLGISAASFVNPYVQITGTLADPFIGLDVAGSAIAGGAAFATGGLTVLAKPLFGRFLQRKSPCVIALERWEQGASQSGSSAVD